MKITVELDSLAELREFMEWELARIDAPARKRPSSAAVLTLER